MTIEEFMQDIAPKMRQGWVAMDEDGEFCWYSDKPELGKYCWSIRSGRCLGLRCFDIASVDDWTQSLRKVGQ